MAQPSKGTVDVDVRDSEPDWDRYVTPKAPEGAPNVLVVLYDDTERLPRRGLSYGFLGGETDQWYPTLVAWVLPRMVERGVMPKGTELTELNPMPDGTSSPLDMVRPWDELSDDEKQLFSRMAEVYAGFSEYTDLQVGRIVEDLEESGQLENTIVFYCADNGASGERSPNGSVSTRAIWHRGWKAGAVHGTTSGIGNFNKDVWQRPVDTSPRDTYVYHPHTSEVPESAAVDVPRSVGR